MNKNQIQLELKIKENKKVIQELYKENLRLSKSVGIFQGLTINLAEKTGLNWKELTPTDIFIEIEKMIIPGFLK